MREGIHYSAGHSFLFFQENKNKLKDSIFHWLTETRTTIRLRSNRTTTGWLQLHRTAPAGILQKWLEKMAETHVWCTPLLTAVQEIVWNDNKSRGETPAELQRGQSLTLRVPLELSALWCSSGTAADMERHGQYFRALPAISHTLTCLPTPQSLPPKQQWCDWELVCRMLYNFRS